MPQKFEKLGFDADQVSARFNKFFGIGEGASPTLFKIATLGRSIANIAEIAEKYENPVDYALYVLAEFFNMSREVKYPYGEIEFYCGTMSKKDLLQSVPVAVQGKLHGFARELRATVSISDDIHLQHLAADFYLNGIGGKSSNNEMKQVIGFLQNEYWETGYRPARRALEFCYLKGIGVAKNSAQALKIHWQLQDDATLNVNRTPSDLLEIATLYEDNADSNSEQIADEMREVANSYRKMAEDLIMHPQLLRPSTATTQPRLAHNSLNNSSSLSV